MNAWDTIGRLIVYGLLINLGMFYQRRKDQGRWPYRWNKTYHSYWKCHARGCDYSIDYKAKAPSPKTIDMIEKVMDHIKYTHVQRHRDGLVNLDKS